MEDLSHHTDNSKVSSLVDKFQSIINKTKTDEEIKASTWNISDKNSLPRGSSNASNSTLEASFKEALKQRSTLVDDSTKHLTLEYVD